MKQPWRQRVLSLVVVAAVIGAVVLAVALVFNLGLLFQAHDRLVSKIACERPMTPIARGSAGNPC